MTPGEPQLLAKADLPIGAYCGPSRSSNGVDYRTAEQFAQYANAGFNYVISERDAVYGHDYKADGSEKTYIDFASSDLKKYLDLAKAVDIDVIVHNQEINDALRSGTGISNGKLSDELKKNIDTMLLDMKGVENFKGILMADEPSDSNQLYYEVVSNYLKNAENMKGKCLYSSLLPYWAGEEAFDSYEGSTKQEKYKGYLKSMSSILGMTNYDFYPFQTNGIRAEWLQNLEMAATVASGKNDVGITLQSTAMSNTAGDAIYRAMDKKAYITYQLYSAMAYGIKNVAFFTYWKHPGSGTVNEVFSDNMVNDDGTINEAVYNAVRDANQEIRAFDDIYMDFSWQGTMKLVNGDEEGILDGISNYQSTRISEAASTEDAIIGCLKNSIGYDGFIIVNVLDPIKTKTSTVTVKFQHATKAIAYVGGEKQIVSLDDGTYTATVQPGEGIFVIPYIE